IRVHRYACAAVDHETASTYAVAAHCGMARIALLYGFDNPRRREHLLLTDVEKDARRAAADARMKALAVELAALLEGGPSAARPTSRRIPPRRGPRCARPTLQERRRITHSVASPPVS